MYCPTGTVFRVKGRSFNNYSGLDINRKLRTNQYVQSLINTGYWPVLMKNTTFRCLFHTKEFSGNK